MRTSFALAAAVAAMLAGVPASAAEGHDQTLIVGSGEVSGAYYPEAGAICRVVNKDRSRHGLHCLVEPTGGSAANIALLRSGDQQLAIVQSRILAQAVAGSGPFAKDGAFPDLRALMSLHGEGLAVVVGHDAKIKTPADLKGKRVNLGLPGSFQRAMADSLLKAEGLTPSDLAAAMEVDPAKQVKALCENHIDAAIFTGLHPMPDVQAALDDCGASLLPLNDAAIGRFLKDNPSFSAETIAEDDYQGLKDKVPTFGLRAVLATTTKLSPDQAYEVVKSVFGNMAPFKAMHPLLAGLDKKAMARDGLAAPLHEGAQKYFHENGLP